MQRGLHSKQSTQLGLADEIALIKIAPCEFIQQFNAGNGDGRAIEILKPEHRPDTKLYATVVLFDPIVHVFRRP